MVNFVYTLLTGILIAAASSWITVQLSLRKFRIEQWWGKRVAAYERVIEALHHSKAFSDVHLDALYDGRDVPDELDKELRVKSKEARREIERAADISGFLLGDEARSRLKQYQKDSNHAKETSSWHEYLEKDWAAVNSCLEDIIEIANKDLKTK